jgi:hypothetical protein
VIKGTPCTSQSVYVRQKHIPEILVFFVAGCLMDGKNVIIIEKSRCVEVLKPCSMARRLHKYSENLGSQSPFAQVFENLGSHSRSQVIL